MAIYVLVHGVGVGGWYWKRLATLLRDAGHVVYAPTLTGLGERAHLLNADIGLETHIEDIVGVLRYEDLSDVILVGHSRGAFVAAGAADRAVDRVAHLVSIDGFVPVNGRSFLDLGPEDWRAFMLGQVVESERGKLFNLPDVRYLGLSDEADIQWFNAKTTPDPFKSLTDPLILHNETALARITQTYLDCIDDAPGGQSAPAWAAGMNYRELRAGHLAMLSAPQTLADVLLELAAP